MEINSISGIGYTTIVVEQSTEKENNITTALVVTMVLRSNQHH